MATVSSSGEAEATGLAHGNASHGAGPGLAVLLHAAGSGPRALDRMARGLAERGWRTLAPAFSVDGGCLIDGVEPFGGATALARGLLEEQAGGPRLLVGHSMGGLVALLALMQGARADAAVLYEPIALALLNPADPGDAAALAWDRACIEGFASRLARGETEAGVAGFIEAYGDVSWNRLPDAIRQELVARAPQILAEAEATHGARLSPDALRRIDVPVLVVQGSRSPAVLGRMADRLAGLLPNLERSVIEGASHMAPVTQADQVLAATLTFLERWGLGAGSAVAGNPRH